MSFKDDDTKVKGERNLSCEGVDVREEGSFGGEGVYLSIYLCMYAYLAICEYLD